jgi:hypothetical protein
MGLLDNLLFGPVKIVHFVGKKIHEVAMEEFLDEEGVRQDLRDLYISLETGKISEKEFEHREEELVDRLEEIKAYKEGR